jgi:hypothetical protein
LNPHPPREADDTELASSFLDEERFAELTAQRPEERYSRRQVYGTFWFEQDALELLPKYADNVMFETDFPHPTSLHGQRRPRPPRPLTPGPRPAPFGTPANRAR